MKNIIFFLLLCMSTATIHCQTFIVREDGLIVKRDTSQFYNVCGDSVCIDVNADNSIDFTIKYSCPIETCCQDIGYHNCRTNQSQYIKIESYNNFETYNYGVVPQLPASYNFNDTLDKYQGDWSHGGWLMAEFYGGPGCYTYYNVGNWWGNPRYLIFRNPNNDNPVYGWVEIQATKPSLGFQIFGFGIEDKKINSIEDNPLSDIMVSFLNDQISLTNIKSRVNVSLIDLNGRILYKQSITSNTNLKTDQLKSGLYLLSISDDQLHIIKKIIK